MHMPIPGGGNGTGTLPYLVRRIIGLFVARQRAADIDERHIALEKGAAHLMLVRRPLRIAAIDAAHREGSVVAHETDREGVADERRAGRERRPAVTLERFERRAQAGVDLVAQPASARGLGKTDAHLL